MGKVQCCQKKGKSSIICNQNLELRRIHYYKNLNGGGRFTFPEAGISDRLQWKITVNQETTAPVKYPASVNVCLRDRQDTTSASINKK
jgi:hypothetical protein